MGLLDFGDRALIQTYAYRAGAGMLQVQGELRKSPVNLPLIKGLLRATCEMIKNAKVLANTLSRSSIESLKIDYNGTKINYMTFVSIIIIDFQNDVKREVGLDLNNFM